MAREDRIKAVKELRKDLTEFQVRIEEYRGLEGTSRENSLALTKIDEASMWLGRELQRLGQPSPYVNSKDPSNSIVDPPAEEIRRQ